MIAHGDEVAASFSLLGETHEVLQDLLIPSLHPLIQMLYTTHAAVEMLVVGEGGRA